MPYVSTRELPVAVRSQLPRQAQIIYRRAFNHAYREYVFSGKRCRENRRVETAHKMAWCAVKREFRRHAGNWVKRNSPPPASRRIVPAQVRMEMENRLAA